MQLFPVLIGGHVKTAVETSAGALSLMHQVFPVHSGLMGERDRPRRIVSAQQLQFQ